MLQEELKKRLLKILSNSEDIDDELINSVANEALDIVGKKDIKQPLILDIAIYRYLLVKGSLATDAYLQNYKNALKALENAPIKSEKSGNKCVIVGKRQTLWY